MKYFVLFALCFFGALNVATAQDDAISRYFSKYVDDERFTVVYVSGKLFRMFQSMELDLDDEEVDAILEVVEDMQGLRLLVTEENPMGFFKEATNTIQTKEYETLMTVRSAEGENVHFMVKDDNNEVVRELLLLVGAEDNFVLMSFVGLINLNKISDLQKAFEGK